MNDIIFFLCAGLNDRFFGKPKFLYPLPNGRTMLETIADNYTEFKKIFVFRKETMESSEDNKKEIERITRKYGFNEFCEVLYLEKLTKGPAETLAKGLGFAKNFYEDDFSFTSRDCDSLFKEGTQINLNRVAYVEKETNFHRYSNIETGENNRITKIIEKPLNKGTGKVSCGAYSFSSNLEYLEAFKKLDQNNGEVFISHVINKMIEEGLYFDINHALNYAGLGTEADYKDYCFSVRSGFYE